jgi:hypothetical protein
MPKTNAELAQAFAIDGYAVKKTELFNGKRGILAEHPAACIGDTAKHKKVLYLEGDGYQMGYLTGLLAEPDVSRMTTEFMDKIILAFVAPGLVGLSYNVTVQIVQQIAKDWCQKVYADHPGDIPAPLVAEMKGIAEGCKAKNPATPVTYEKLLSLNAGADCLVAAIYTGLGLYERLEAALPLLDGIVGWLARHAWLIPLAKKLVPALTAQNFAMPISCNVFAAYGNATKDGKFYFGRDFQFPTAGVYEHTACLIIYNPEYQLNGQAALPLVSQAAPGFVGSATAMNSRGVAIGENMVPSGDCDPARPGLNALLMTRYAGHCGYSAQHVVDAMTEAQRGASWIYPVGDGTLNRAVMIEAGMKTDQQNYLDYPPKELKPLLQGLPFEPWQKGLKARWGDYVLPDAFLLRNKELFQYMDFPYNPALFRARRFLNPDWENGLSQSYFFAPQRESKSDLLVACNHYITPEMRLCAMREWTNLVALNYMPDNLWRYDELSRQCYEAYGGIDAARARQLIDFLSPDGSFPDYYGDNPVIKGSVSLCNLTDKTIISHYGFQPDEWMKVTLPNYV